MRANKSKWTRLELDVYAVLMGIPYLEVEPHALVAGHRVDFLLSSESSARRVALEPIGCMWHGCPVHYRAPRTNAAYWRDKLVRNRARDVRVCRRVASEGVLVRRIWECRVRANPECVADTAIRALWDPGAPAKVSTLRPHRGAIRRRR